MLDPTSITIPEIPWVRTPRSLHFFNNRDLTRTDRCVWQAINTAAQIHTRKGAISVTELARSVECSQRTVYYSLSRLRKADLIEVNCRPGRRNVYRTCHYATPAKTCSTNKLTPAKDGTTQSRQSLKTETTAAAAELRSRVPEPVKADDAVADFHHYPVVKEPPPPPPPPLPLPAVPEVVASLMELGVAESVAQKEAQRVSAKVALAVLAIVVQIVSRGSILNPAGLAITALRNPKRFMPFTPQQKQVKYPQCGHCGKDILREHSYTDGFHLGCYHEYLRGGLQDTT